MYDLSKLKSLHEKATQGEWENSTGFVRARTPVEAILGENVRVTLSCTWVAETVRGEGYVPGNGNAEYIAALHNAFPQIAAALDRAQRVEEALVKLTHRADRIGGDRDGMPECPWCHNDQGLLHDNDCDLVSARAALKESKDG